MKNILFVVILFISKISVAQQYPEFKPLRFEENYNYLKNDTANKDWYKALKFTPLNNSSTIYLSFGGDFRYQYFHVKNETWGDVPKDTDGYVLGRYLLHTDLHLGTHFRTFIQIQGSTADGRIDPSPVERNPLDLHQAFAEVSFTNTVAEKLLFRAGRQEFYYGSQRLISVREGPNTRQSFDALKLLVAKGNYSVDFFYGHHVVVRDGIFDDNSNADKRFWGSYFILKKVPVLKNVDLYYLGYKRTKAIFDDGMGREMRHSVGTRLWGKYQNWRYDGEAVWQFGSLETKNICAWTASLNTGYRFTSIKLHPEIGLKGEVVSGDRYRGDDSMETFNPLFPRGAYFGLAAMIGPANLIDFHPSLSVEFSNEIDWGIDYDMFWRYSKNDGIYTPSVSIIYQGNTTESKKIGNQLGSEIVWQPNQYLYFRIEATWFEAGDYLQASGMGKDIFFTGATLQVHF